MAPGRRRRHVPVCRDRRRRLGPGRGPPPPPGRPGRHGVREERGRGGHLAGERLPGLPGGRAQPALQLLLRPDQRLGVALLGAARPVGLPAVDRQGAGARGVHPVPERGDGGPLRRRHTPVVADGAGRRRHRGDRGRRRRRLRRGPAQPPVLSGHRRSGALRGPVVPLGGLGRLGGARRAARRGDRDRGQRGTVRPVPGGGGGPPRRLPAHPALAAADGELRRPLPARVPPPAGAAAHLRALGQVVAVLAHARGAAGGGPGRPRVGRARRGRERRQRLRAFHAARRPARPGRGRCALREDGTALPTLRQARAARRRALGGGARAIPTSSS